MRVTRIAKIVLVIALFVVSVIGARTIALAHAKIQSADPKPGSTIAKAPAMVKIVFTLAPDESLDPKTSTITVSDGHGRRADDGKGGVDLNDMDRKTLIAMLKPLTADTYTVRWKAVSNPDKDVAQGSFTFTVTAAAGSMRMASPAMAMSHPPLKIISPAAGATVASPVEVVFETTADLPKMTMGAMDAKMQPVAHVHADLDKRVLMPVMKQIKVVGEHRALVSDVLMKRDDEGARADAGVGTTARTTTDVTLRLKPDPRPGVFVVMWRVLSIDTHTTQGFHIFILAPKR